MMNRWRCQSLAAQVGICGGPGPRRQDSGQPRLREMVVVAVPGRAGVGADDDREGCRGQGEAGVDCEAGADAGGEPRRVNVGFGEVARPLCDDDCAP
jgi:hypothetical protein